MILHRRALLSAAGLACLPFAPARAQGFASAETQAALQGLYWPAVNEMRAQVGDDPGTMAQIRASLGDEAGATTRLSMATASDAYKASLETTVVEDALEAIVRESRGRRLVILNEAHNASRHRAFATIVAEALRREGFTWFAAEALTNLPELIDRLQQGGPVTHSEGFYTTDPVFAELIRSVQRVGYRLAAYEQTDEQSAPPSADRDTRIAAREEAQAENLMAVLGRDPQARMFIYCGYSHAAKVPLGRTTWMAARLKQKSGLDPLCIAQAQFVTPPLRQNEPAQLSLLLDRHRFEAPFAVKQADGAAFAVGHPAGAFDLAIAHPRIANVDGRPGWLAKLPGRLRATWTLKEPAAAESLIQAAPPGPPNVVPADQYVIGPDVREAVFFLRPGQYDVRLETQAGRTVLGKLSV